MYVKPEKESINTVELGSSDDEEGCVRDAKRSKTSIDQQQQQQEQQPLQSVPVIGVPELRATGLEGSSGQDQASLECRSFWKAGDYHVPHKKPGPVEDLEHARVHPKFLHSNATSHKGPLGAIAELLDNAVDEICHGATFVKVDRIYNSRDNSPALLFQDDGGGMDPGCMRQCMSLGYSEKKANTTIGQYGNGFKTSTMRLGADAIVFSCATRGSHATQSIGLLSYTFLRRTGQDDVIVPMVDFELVENQRNPIIYTSQDDWSGNLNLIAEWSPFATKEELMRQFDDIGCHGTKIIIYNLWLNDESLVELDFDSDEEDIRLRDEVTRGQSSRKHDRIIESHISYRLRFSLRAYASILYLRKFTNFQIILRGVPVQQYNIEDELKFSKVITYRPHIGSISKEVSVEATIGFLKEAPLIGVSGFNVYHKNRLIRPFWKLTNECNSRGNGVVGVLEANFIEPAHDKQDFERSTLFLRLEMRLKQMTIDYWKSHFHLLGFQSPGIRNVQGCSADEIHADQHVIGLAANSEPGISKQQSIVAPHFQDVPLGQHVIGLAAEQSLHTSAVNKAWRTAGESGSLAPLGSKEGSSADGRGSELIDKLCDENIQLFMRCEEHRQKEVELRQTIEDLEAKLEDKKKKCSLLVSRIESQKKQRTIK